MKEISRIVLLLLCFAALPNVSAFASPSETQYRQNDKAEIIVHEGWWSEAKWLLPPRISEAVDSWLDSWLDSTYAKGVGWLTENLAPPPKETVAKPLEIIINKGVMSGNPG